MYSFMSFRDAQLPPFMLLEPPTMQVRAAATMGGNLVLAKEKALESDVATLLSALQAQVGITSVDKEDLRYHPSMHDWP